MPLQRFYALCKSLLPLTVLFFLLPTGIPLSAGDTKLSLPAEADLKKAAALVKEVYQKEYKLAAKDPLEKSRLAAVFLQEGRDTKDYPAGRYVLFQEAYKLAAEVGDVQTALQAVDALALSFPLEKAEVFDRKVNALQRASEAAVGGETYRQVVDAALILLEDALAGDDYESALRLVQTAEAAGINLRSVPLVASIRERQKEVLRLKKDYDKVRPYVEKLAANPKDSKANLEVGKYHAFLKDNWEKGLPYLARAGAPVGAVAKLEFQEKKTSNQLIQLAEGWRNIARDLTGKSQAHVLLRAYQWYLEAEIQLQGKQREQVAAVMQQILDALPPEYRVGEIAHEVRQFSGHNGPVFDAAFSPDGRQMVSGGQDGAVIVWDVQTGKIVRLLHGHDGPVWTVAFSPDGRHVLSGSFDKSIRLWDLTSGKEIRRFDGHDDYVRGAVFLPDGKQILSCGDDRTLRLWDAGSGKEVYRLPVHKHYVWNVALSRDGKLAASASLDRTVRLWQVPEHLPPGGPFVDQTEWKRFTGHDDTVFTVAISPDGRQVLSGSSDKTLRLWDIATGKETLVLKGHEGFVTSVAFTPDGRRALSAGYDQTLRLWDLQSGEEIRALEGHGERIWSVAFSRDGRWAISAGHDGTVRLWGSKK